MVEMKSLQQSFISLKSPIWTDNESPMIRNTHHPHLLLDNLNILSLSLSLLKERLYDIDTIQRWFPIISVPFTHSAENKSRFLIPGFKVTSCTYRTSPYALLSSHGHMKWNSKPFRKWINKLSRRHRVKSREIQKRLRTAVQGYRSWEGSPLTKTSILSSQCPNRVVIVTMIHVRA